MLYLVIAISLRCLATTLLIAIMLSTQVEASGFLRFAAHSLHETNCRQTLHFAPYSEFLPGVKHFVAYDPQPTVVISYHKWWHQMIDVAPLLIGEKPANAITIIFIAAKLWIVMHNNEALPDAAYWIIHYNYWF